MCIRDSISDMLDISTHPSICFYDDISDIATDLPKRFYDDISDILDISTHPSICFYDDISDINNIIVVNSYVS